MINNWLIFAGMVLAFALGFFVSQGVGPIDFAEEFWAFAGALIGAGVTVYGAIAVATYGAWRRGKEVKEARRRQQLGARAMLALDLSRTMDHARQSADAAMSGERLIGVEQDGNQVPCPELKAEILPRFQHLVELLEGQDANQVADLMQCYQIQQTRLSDALELLNYPERLHPRGLTLDDKTFPYTAHYTVQLYLRADAIFPFARCERESIAPPPFPQNSVRSAVVALGLENWLSEEKINQITDEMTTLSPLARWRRT